MVTITRHDVELVQGQDEEGRRFGYVAGDNGGFFFTWNPTLDDTLSSIEEDEADGDGGLERAEVLDFLEEYLPATRRGRQMWEPDRLNELAPFTEERRQ